ncbi:hypothetical protein D7207_29540 [Burkholderia cepacia]|nr:hypothetical protein [Burkholderia cepacia]ODN63419.1 hypothetical protein BA763_01210 [Burkholderia cenocepacia]RBQ59727.1 hypothetical protein DI458_24620 [Burkholderia contaminans]MBA9977955.1 hypothetical protein [Burkholderia cepacia]MBA9996764.1 hypothetical protein [Burkholderia cepacia]
MRIRKSEMTIIFVICLLVAFVLIARRSPAFMTWAGKNQLAAGAIGLLVFGGALLTLKHVSTADGLQQSYVSKSVTQGSAAPAETHTTMHDALPFHVFSQGHD